MNLSKKIKNLGIYSLIIFCLTLVPNVHAFSDNQQAPSKNETDISINPYVEAYLQYESKREMQVEQIHSIVDPEIRKQINVQTLNTYYIKDVEVGKILSKLLKDSNYNQKAISLEIDDRIEVLHSIVDNYKLADEQVQEQFKGYMIRYSEKVNDELSIELLESITPKERTLSILATYNGAQAANWAYDNYDKYNSNYPAFNNGWGNDCANFVSQAMHEGGGMAFVDDWYVYKLNSVYPSPANASQLDYSWDLADPSPWISASEFASYWRGEVPNFYYSKAKYISDHEDIYYYDITLGDAVVFNTGFAGIFDIAEHIMIISRYDSVNKDFKLAGHSNMRQAYPLLDAIQNYSSIYFLRF